jgi:hypothetical protein
MCSSKLGQQIYKISNKLICHVVIPIMQGKTPPKWKKAVINKSEGRKIS